MKLKIYVAGPISKGNYQQNIQRGLNMGNRLWKKGFVPFIPHVNDQWHNCYNHDYEERMAFDQEWLLTCDAVLRLEGESLGADREEVFARHNNIPVFTDMKELLQWAKTK